MDSSGIKLEAKKQKVIKKILSIKKLTFLNNLWDKEEIKWTQSILN
jgi:hypothetical protein